MKSANMHIDYLFLSLRLENNTFNGTETCTINWNPHPCSTIMIWSKYMLYRVGNMLLQLLYYLFAITAYTCFFLASESACWRKEKEWKNWRDMLSILPYITVFETEPHFSFVLSCILFHVAFLLLHCARLACLLKANSTLEEWNAKLANLWKTWTWQKETAKVMHAPNSIALVASRPRRHTFLQRLRRVCKRERESEKARGSSLGTNNHLGYRFAIFI